MSKKEKNLDIFISKLLDSAKIKYSADGSSIKEINDALKTASKKGTGRVGFPEFVGVSKDFIIVIEDKAELEKQANYSDEEETELATDVKSLKDFAENGALHYGKHIVENTNFKKVFAFGCSGDEKHHVIRPIFIVVPHAEKANAQIGTFGFCRPTIQTQKTKRAYFFTRAQTDRQ